MGDGDVSSSCTTDDIGKYSLGSNITVMPLSFSSIPHGALTALLKYAYLEFVSALRSVKSRVCAEKRGENGRESERGFKGTRPAKGRKDGGMELREDMEKEIQSPTSQNP